LGLSRLALLRAPEREPQSDELPERTLLRPSEVASFFNVSVETVYLWLREGKIEGIKIGRTVRIYRSSLEEDYVPLQQWWR